MNYNDFTILIVDDIPQNLKIVGTILTQQGYKTFASLSGKQAIETVNEKDIDMILLDISMPELNGFEVCKILKSKRKTKDIPVIFLTARTQIEDVVQGFEVGGVDYITKPFNTRELLKRVETHLQLRHQKKIILQQNQELKELNVAKSKFLSIISHDLRNPFSAILMLAELLLENNNEINEIQKGDVIEKIKSGSQNVMTLLEDLLSWSRSQIHNLNLTPENFYLKTIAEDTVKLLKEQYQAKKINVKLEVNEDCKVYADTETSRTIIRNLLSNAIKFTETEGNIKITAKEIENNFIQVDVIDDGIGISESKKEQLFRIDRKVSTTGTDKEKGSGLGLILCKEFVEKNGGKIWFDSKEGEGSTFSFTLPKNKD